MNRRKFFKSLGMLASLPIAAKLPDAKGGSNLADRSNWIPEENEFGLCHAYKGEAFNPSRMVSGNHVLSGEELRLHIKNSTELAFLGMIRA